MNAVTLEAALRAVLDGEVRFDAGARAAYASDASNYRQPPIGVVLPRSAFGFDGRCTLDGISAEQVGTAHPARVHLASSPAELLEILES